MVQIPCRLQLKHLVHGSIYGVIQPPGSFKVSYHRIAEFKRRSPEDRIHLGPTLRHSPSQPSGNVDVDGMADRYGEGAPNDFDSARRSCAAEPRLIQGPFNPDCEYEDRLPCPGRSKGGGRATARCWCDRKAGGVLASHHKSERELLEGSFSRDANLLSTKGISSRAKVI